MEEGDVVEIGLMTTGVVRTNKILRQEAMNTHHAKSTIAK